MSPARRTALAVSVVATVLLLAAAFLTAHTALYILAGLSAASTAVLWHYRGIR